jgi:hypothetical protein
MARREGRGEERGERRGEERGEERREERIIILAINDIVTFNAYIKWRVMNTTHRT